MSKKQKIDYKKVGEIALRSSLINVIQKEIDGLEESKDDFIRAHLHGLKRARYLIRTTESF